MPSEQPSELPYEQPSELPYEQPYEQPYELHKRPYELPYTRPYEPLNEARSDLDGEPGHPPETHAGPYDSEDAPDDGVPRLDLGSLRFPVPDHAQLHAEVDPAGAVLAVHVLTQRGQFTLNAFAAPRGRKLWNHVRHDLAMQLTGSGARVSEEAGEWGREVIVERPDMVMRFVGVDGPRWLLRGFAAGAADNAAMLAEQLRDMLRDTVVVRGPEPMPVQSPLPLTLPETMVG